MATLTISHYIYLTKDERYKLHEGQPMEVVGVSVPVWFHKGSTTKPAQEMFVKYRLTNCLPNRAITAFEEGYCINLPQKNDLTAPIQVQQAVGVEVGTSERLLNYKDGGSEYLEFRQYSKVQKHKRTFNVVHFVELKPVEDLLETLS
jgi:hypothetical protein